MSVSDPAYESDCSLLAMTVDAMVGRPDQLKSVDIDWINKSKYTDLQLTLILVYNTLLCYKWTDITEEMYFQQMADASHKLFQASEIRGSKLIQWAINNRKQMAPSRRKAFSKRFVQPDDLDW